MAQRGSTSGNRIQYTVGVDTMTMGFIVLSHSLLSFVSKEVLEANAH